MKGIVAIACVLALLMGLAVTANAAAFDDTWLVSIRACNSLGLKGFTYSAGTTSTSTDGFVPGAEEASLPPPAGGCDLVEIYSVRIDNDGVSHNCALDKREKLSPNKLGEVWAITVIKQENYVGDIYLKAWNLANTSYDIDDDCTFPIRLYNVTGGVRQLLWTYNPTDNGTWRFNLEDGITSDGVIYEGLLGPSADGQGNAIAYNLELVAGVPEPGSIVAMLCGLAGFAGYSIRRRK